MNWRLFLLWPFIVLAALIALSVIAVAILVCGALFWPLTPFEGGNAAKRALRRGLPL